MNTNANTGTNNTANTRTASQKRFRIVEVLGNRITENVLMNIPPATNKFLRSVDEKELPNGFKMKAHRKIGKKIHGSGDQAVIMNFHYYGFDDKHLGRQMVCKLKLVEVTREDGKSFLAADVYRQPAGTEAKWIFTISYEKGILIRGTDARVLLKKALPRPSAPAVSNGTETEKPETLATDTAIASPIVEAPAETRVSAPHADGYAETGKKTRRREKNETKSPKKKGSRLSKYDFKEVSGDKPKTRRKSYQQTPEQKIAAILAEAKDNNWTVISKTTTEIVLDLGEGMTITRAIG